MNRSKWMLFGFVIVLAFALMISTGCTKKEEEQEAKAQITKQEEKEEAKLPAAVVKAIEDNIPDADIEDMEVEEKGGIVLYDIEFEANQGEIEVAEDGSIIDIATIITMEEVPEAAAKALKEATEGLTIVKIEKSEVWSEVKMEGDVGTIVKFDSPKYIYEAEVTKDGQTGEIEVAADGTVIEPLKWETQESPERN